MRTAIARVCVLFCNVGGDVASMSVVSPCIYEHVAYVHAAPPCGKLFLVCIVLFVNSL